MLGYLLNLFKSLNSNSHPGEIAHGAALGVIMGMIPKDNVLWYILFVLFFFIRINKAVYLLVTLGVSLCIAPADMMLDAMGYQVLMFEPLVPVYRQLLEIPFVAYTKFNNTVVMGSLAAGLILYIPVYVLIRLLVKLWRTVLAPKITASKLWVGMKKLPLVEKIVSKSQAIAGVLDK
ncbi:MAG: TIGR03546 family protein [Spirochaetaceae bacterium]|nr:TIGR03546 family protein [Spirochaetaceae bacterium]